MGGITHSPHSTSCSMRSSPTNTMMSFDFSIGDAVEVVSSSQRLVVSYYEATVMSCLPNAFYVVEYSSLLNDDDNYNFLTQTLHASHLRPLPPPRIVVSFSLHQAVDAFEDEGWWPTRITQTKSGSDLYVVYSQTTQRDAVFQSSELRVHQEWINGQWVF